MILNSGSGILLPIDPLSQAPNMQRRPLSCLPSDNNSSTANVSDGISSPSLKLTSDLPNLKRRCDKLREETEELEKEYENRKLQARSNFLKTIKEYEQKKSACEAKLNELNKLIGEDITRL